MVERDFRDDALHHDFDRGAVVGLVVVFALCLTFWSGVGYGIYWLTNRHWHPTPDRAPSSPQPKPDPAGVSCTESSPPKPHIGTAIICQSVR
jgi:hypothetical protein